jgi:hypothetical protein
VYVNCTKPGGPPATQLASYYADGTNSFSRVIKEYYQLAIAMGADGIFHDEFPHSEYSYTYHSPWDNRSLFLHPVTLAPLDAPVPASLVLLTHENELALARMLDDQGSVMCMNGSPETRSWYRNALQAKSPTINENENGCMWRALHVQIYTPIMLTRYGACNS